MMAYLNGRQSELTLECHTGEEGFIHRRVYDAELDGQVASGFQADNSRVDVLNGHVTVISGKHPFPDELELNTSIESVTICRPDAITDDKWAAAVRMVRSGFRDNLNAYHMPYDCPFCGVKAGG